MFLKTAYILNTAKALLIGGVLMGAQALTADDIPSAHERTLDGMLKSYQRELNALVPVLTKDPNSKKAKEFVQVYFMADTVSILNHITPGNVKPDKALEPLADKTTLRVGEFLKLAGGMYKKGFKYELDRDAVEFKALDSTSTKDRFVHRYRLTTPVKVQGSLNAQLQVEVQDTLDIYASVYSDGKRNVRYARIQTMVRKGSSLVPAPAPTPDKPEPKTEPQPAPDVNAALIDWPIERKVEAVLASLKILSAGATEEQFDKIKDDAAVIFGPSGYVNLETKDGQKLRLPRVGFLMRARDTKAAYELKQSTLVQYDQFRENSLSNWFCRSTTYHEVSRFDKGAPVPAKVTSVQRMPMMTKAPTSKKSYWQIVELTLKEK
ncbi:MAG: hypothetical protein U0X91_27540 [Spirosomataceae bacterium]